MTLDAFHQHYNQLPAPLRDDQLSLPTTRQLHLECLLNEFRLKVQFTSVQSTALSDLQQRYELGIVLDGLFHCADLLRINPNFAGARGGECAIEICCNPLLTKGRL